MTTGIQRRADPDVRALPQPRPASVTAMSKRARVAGAAICGPSRAKRTGGTCPTGQRKELTP
jgi:hypothetical protein